MADRVAAKTHVRAVSGFDELRAELTYTELDRRRGPLLGRQGRRATAGDAHATHATHAHAHSQRLGIETPSLLRRARRRRDRQVREILRPSAGGGVRRC